MLAEYNRRQEDLRREQERLKALAQTIKDQQEAPSLITTDTSLLAENPIDIQDEQGTTQVVVSNANVIPVDQRKLQRDQQAFGACRLEYWSDGIGNGGG